MKSGSTSSLSIIAACAFACLLLLPAGWTLGYRSGAAYVLFWLSAILVALTVERIVRDRFRWAGFADYLVRFAVLAFALVVACELALGSAGILTVASLLALLTVVLATLGQIDSTVERTPPNLTALPIVPIAIVGALATFMVGYGLTHSPLTLYDSVSYHLYFPARWFHEHRLSIIPTPFSDEAQAYAPANGELFLLWLMLPLHGDLVARMGQLPFWFLAAIALFAIARRSGARAEHAIYASAFFMLARPIVGQAIGANVDLMCAAMFLASLYLGIVAVERNDRRDWAVWGVSVGLYAGTKYLALVYLPVLLLLPILAYVNHRDHGEDRDPNSVPSVASVVRGGRARALWAIPGVLAFAGSWYVRNWVVAGSPIYPASLQIAGMTIAQGAFGRGAMLDTVFHTGGLRLLPAVAAHGLGATLFIVWLPVFVIAAALVLVRRHWWPAGCLLLLAVAMFPLEWFGIPVNVDSRFLMPAIALSALSFALVFGQNRFLNAAVHGVYAAAMIWILIGRDAEIPAKLPWFMDGWLSLDGVIDRRFAVWFAAMAAAIAVTWLMTRRRPAWGLFAVAALCGAGSIALVFAAPRFCAASSCDYLRTESPFIRANYVSGWRWIGENIRDATFAYTGINLPYPLSGERLTNRVYYVNIDRHPDWRFHDYARARRHRTADEGQLARASGELMPVSDRARAANEALRPRYERTDGDRDRWIENLKARHVDHLFVATLSAYEIDWQWHTGQGFPIEDEWARADPVMFPLLYENPQVRIYLVDFTRRSGA